MKRFLPLALFCAALVAGCTDLPLNEYGDMPTDGQMKISSLADAAQQISRLSVMEPGLIKEIKALPTDNKSLLNDRLEEVLISALTKRGLFVGAVESSGLDSGLEDAWQEKEGAGGNLDDGSGTPMTEDIPKGGETPKETGPAPADEPTYYSGSSASVEAGTLEYRLVECRMVYTTAGSSIKRQAVSVVHVRVPSPSGDGYAWVGDVTGLAEDVVPISAAENLIDTRYADIGPTAPEKEDTPILEPIIVTAVTVGLIVLFSFTSQ